MKKHFLYLIGLLLLFPNKTFAFGIDAFRKEIFRPENLSAPSTGSISAEGRIIEILNFVINLILFASGSIAVLILVFGGLRYVSSLGNEEDVDGAKKLMKYALYGLLTIILAYAIVTNVVNIIYRATA